MSHQASHGVEAPIDGRAADTRGMLQIHVVTDCNLLHETVIKSRLPEDKQAAIEVIAIREMVTDEGFSSDSDVEDIGRLKERDLADVYHWCVSEDQRADILTKKSLTDVRREWMTNKHFIAIRGAKRTDDKLKKIVPSALG